MAKKYHDYFDVFLRPLDGIQGEPGPIPYPAGIYDPDKQYVRTKDKAPFVFLDDKYYLLAKFGIWKGVNPAEDTEGVWEVFEDMLYVFARIVLAEFAMFGSAIFKDNKLISQKGTVNGVESYEYTDPNFEPYISLDFLDGFIKGLKGEFAGTLKSVSGSFKRLNCVDENGNTIGTIRFGAEGRIYFEGCKLYHQAPTGPFYMADAWIRGVLGVHGRTALVISGASWGYVYKDGLDGGSAQYVSLSSGKDSSGNTYYDIPLYSPTSETSGMPIDLVIINHSSAQRYNLPYIPGKDLVLINSKDQNSDIYIYTNGITVKVYGGSGLTLACVGNNQSPDNSYWLGRGWMITGLNDNTWA